jgi:hypothetical protein
MTDLNLKLLSDLARLAAAYEPADFEQLAALLDDRARRNQVRGVLLELAAVSCTRRTPAKARSGRPGAVARIRDGLATIRAEDPARGEFLDDIWTKLRNRELLPTLATVRAFADAIGSKGIASSRRDQAVAELMEQIIHLPGDTLEERMRHTIAEERDLGKEYDRWVQLILRSPAKGRSSDTD